MNWRLVLGAAALVLCLGACGDESSDGGSPPSCEAGAVLCGGACADTATDPRHCGACGTACADGEACSDGVCTLICPGGQVACGGGCFDTATSPAHCGSCGTTCAAGEACSEGSCVATCPAGQERCDGGCFDTASSPVHCGACGVACEAGESCTDGACVATCPAGQELCDGGCFDLQKSRENCGICGTTCGEGEVCAAGACAPTCGAGQIDCDGSCVDTARDAENCGSCGNACGDAELCVDGACQLACADGLLACGGACRDVRNDRNNCGACGVACGDAQSCSEGSCVTACGGFASQLCDGACTNTDVDPNNCGACGNACGAGEVCSDGMCTGYCAPSLTQCQDGACTSLQDDPANCGACGTACGSIANGAAVCTTGACDVVCLNGYGDCNGDMRTTGGDGCESTFATDLDNCGFCGNVCPTPDNATRTCAAGLCGVGQCNPGFGNCDQSDFNGCETNLNKDVFHCGGCNIACGINQYCDAGTCKNQVGADHCLAAPTLQAGRNVIHWHAASNDYITTKPSCSTPANTDPEGPDLVFQYTPTFNGKAEINFNPPSSTRWHALIDDSLCGSFDGPVCLSASGTLNGMFDVTSGTTYSIYLVGSQGDPLRNPLTIDVTELNCATLAPAVTVLAPANGATNPTLDGRFTATFSHAVKNSAGTFTLIGDKGTERTFLHSDPAVTFAANGRSVTIAAGEFRPQERVTITWTGVEDRACSAPVPSPTWAVTMPLPPCTPGEGGVVGSTVTRIPFPYLGSLFQENYVLADDEPNGWVYVGTGSVFYRMRKDGSVAEDLTSAHGFGSKHRGQHMLFAGNAIYAANSSSTGQTERVFRLTSDKGQTFGPEDAIFFPTEPGKVVHTSGTTVKGMAAWGGRLFLVYSHSGGGRTEVWSADMTGALPAQATLELTLQHATGYELCGGIAVDAANIFTTCRLGTSSTYKMLRIDRTTHAVTEMVTAPDTWASGSTTIASDTDGDGIADVLYHRGDDKFGSYVCTPTVRPYIDEHFRFATNGSTGAGMSLDPVGKALWLYDRSTFEFIKVQ